MAVRPGEDGKHVTFCRICEAFCGLVANVENGRITSIEPDRDNPHSQGHVCVKGVSFDKVVHDPDRVLRPLKRTGGPGEFSPVEWGEALDDIATRLGTIIERDGSEAVAFYLGNPSSYATDAVLAHGGFMKAIGSGKGYSPGSQDSNARVTANFALFGTAMLNAFPDLPRCDFLLVFGANPLVSNGSILFAPRLRHDLDAIAARGRVVVVDPRRTETARRYEHLAIRPNGDVWLLLAMLKSLFENDLVDRAAVMTHADGLAAIEEELRTVDMMLAAERAGIDADDIRELARAFAAAGAAAAYGRVGICRGPFATLTNCLVTILNIVTGNFGSRPGGTVFGHRVMAGQERGRFGGHGESASRIGGIPSVARFHAGAVMADDMLEPGEGQVKAFMLTAGNPLLSAPGGTRLAEALEQLELFVSFDLYVNETARYADYVLPVPTFFEREDVPFMGMNILIRPFLQYSDAVLPPQGDSRHEHEIWREIIERMGLVWPSRGENGPSGKPGLDHVDRLLRSGPVGEDALGADGWSLQRLVEFPHGVLVDTTDPTTEPWWERLGHPEKRVQLYHPMIAAEFARLREEWAEPPELALIGKRDIRSINSWMHNVEGLVRSQKPVLTVHPDDAERIGLGEGDEARLASDVGELLVRIAISDEVRQGTLCYPHGWGHGGGWTRANAAPGDNINLLLGQGPEAVEFVSGTTLMDGIPVTLERVESSTKAPERQTATQG
ncbi:MAG: molybdopterin-dependent oxidoreductase [Parasphingopyxis sp.]|uniref:molybdopterin-containing oxidoreductase family protein n=1 Tax=Parasphingopyxis sp. TaxID=1920299 RepID=UPI0032EC5017